MHRLFKLAATHNSDINLEENSKAHSCSGNSKPLHGHPKRHRLWQGIQVITNYRPALLSGDGDSSLPVTLNKFYSRIEKQNDTLVRKSTPLPNDHLLYL